MATGLFMFAKNLGSGSAISAEHLIRFSVEETHDVSNEKNL